MIHYDKEKVPNATEDWILPEFLMSTYDGDVVSWRAMIPHSFIGSEEASAIFNGVQYYVYQTMPQLPSGWNMTYDAPTGLVSVFVQGLAGMCGSSFDQAQAEQEYGIVFEGDDDDDDGESANNRSLRG
jgi:hypothetical protein